MLPSAFWRTLFSSRRPVALSSSVWVKTTRRIPCEPRSEVVYLQPFLLPLKDFGVIFVQRLNARPNVLGSE